MKIGIDYRPALQNREGIGRATRELVRALVELDGPDGLGDAGELSLFGWTLAPMRYARDELGIDDARARLARWRFPSRWIPGLCERLGRGVDDLVGGCDVFHHTQSHVLPVRRAVEVATIYDCIYLRPGGSVSPAAAAAMTRAAHALVARARRIVVPSAYVARDVVTHLGAVAARVHVAHLGCDHVRRGAHVDPYGARDRSALTVSRVDGRKNHVRMLRAFERLLAAGALERWIVAGPDGHGAESFDEAVRRSPARDAVERVRHVADSDLARLYARARVFLFASLDEGFGLPPLEALACGAPVVAGDNSSMPEILGDAALYVDARDEDAIHDAALRVIDDQVLAHRLRERGLARAGEFTWRACARATLAAYRAAVEVR